VADLCCISSAPAPGALAGIAASVKGDESLSRQLVAETESLPRDRREHRAIVDAMVQGNHREARKIVSGHLASSEELLLGLMRAQEVAQASGKVPDVKAWARSALGSPSKRTGCPR
jgi:hypothetical protein